MNLSLAFREKANVGISKTCRSVSSSKPIASDMNQHRRNSIDVTSISFSLEFNLQREILERQIYSVISQSTQTIGKYLRCDILHLNLTRAHLNKFYSINRAINDNTNVLGVSLSSSSQLNWIIMRILNQVNCFCVTEKNFSRNIHEDLFVMNC